MLTEASIGFSDLTGSVCSVLALFFGFGTETIVLFCTVLRACAKESLLGRPLLRFGERGGLLTSLVEVGCGDGVPVFS